MTSYCWFALDITAAMLVVKNKLKHFSPLGAKQNKNKADFRLRPQRAWHYNHVTFTPIAKHFMLYCRLIYMLSILFVRLTIKVKVGIPESFKVGWYPPKKTGSSHLNGKVVF